MRTYLATGLVAAALLPIASHAQVARIRVALPLGPHPVGFRQHWATDPTRVYPNESPAKGRPILVRAFYPAVPKSGRTLTYGEVMATPVAKFPAYGWMTEAYTKNASSYLVGDSQDKLSPDAKARLEVLKKTKLDSRHDARAAKGEFPLVIYHGGANSTPDDNVLMCEFIASHGYHVLTSTFLEGRGGSFNIDGQKDSYLDIEFLIDLAAKQGIPTSRVALIGHSAGAHTILRYRGLRDRPLGLLVSLDTTQDNFSVNDERWRSMSEAVLENLPKYTTPTIFFGPETGFYALGDSMTSCERLYVSTTNMGHDDYTSQGVLGRWGQQETSDITPAISGFASMCKLIVGELNHFVKQNGDRFIRDLTAGPFTREYAKRGDGFPDPKIDAPLTPRQVRPYLKSFGRDQMAKRMREVHAADPKAPIFQGVFAFSLLLDLTENGITKSAETLFATYRSLGIDLQPTFESWIFLSERVSRQHLALRYVRLLLALDPANEYAQKKLKELEGSTSLRAAT